MRSLLTAAAISMAFPLFLTPMFLRLFRRWGWAQVIRTDDGRFSELGHEVKRGTPTMGGVIFILGTLVGYFVGCLTGGTYPTIPGLLVLWMMVGFGLIGFIDDFLKVRRANSAGLSGWRKIIGQILVTIPFGVIALTVPNESGQVAASSDVSIFRDIPQLNLFFLGTVGIGAVVGWLLYLAWVSFIGVGTSNSTNLLDGNDGLLAGSSVFVVGGYSLIAFWQYQQSCHSDHLEPAFANACYDTTNPFGLAIVAAAFTGSLVGFLWWNAPKAKLFMGDTGSMAIGGVVAALAILTRTELLLVLMGGVYILASGSVILQRLYFKATGGKRLFLNSPFHHHLEMRGWPEVTIVIRLWIVSGLLVMSAIGLFYVEWLSRT